MYRRIVETAARALAEMRNRARHQLSMLLAARQGHFFRAAGFHFGGLWSWELSVTCQRSSRSPCGCRQSAVLSSMPARNRNSRRSRNMGKSGPSYFDVRRADAASKAASRWIRRPSNAPGISAYFCAVRCATARMNSHWRTAVSHLIEVAERLPEGPRC